MRVNDFRDVGKQHTRLGGQWTPHGQLNGDYGVAIPVADAIAAPIECSNIILRRHHASKVSCGRRTAWHLR